MTVIARPNAWVAVEDDPATQLTYAPRVDPAPLTVTVPGRDPTLGSLVVVITNQTTTGLDVASVTFTITVGEPGVGGTPLMPTTDGSHALVSDTTTWSVAWPDQPVTSGTVDCALTPAAGGTAKLAAGASVWVQIYDFQTVQVPSTSQITVAEAIGSGDPVYTYLQISTFPDGFFFDSLTATVKQGSALVPVAQVAGGASVVLTWNSSLVDVKSQTVYWSSATAGQQSATPTALGAWVSPPLTSDTVFVVVVSADSAGDEPLTASLATAVSVQNPELVASAVQTGTLTATADATVGGMLHANGGLTASAATVNGALTAGGALTASGALSANGGLTSSGATVNGVLTATGAKVSMLHAGQSIPLPTGEGAGYQAKIAFPGGATVTIALGTHSATYVANTDGLVVAAVGWPPPGNIGQTNVLAMTYAAGTGGGLTLTAGGAMFVPTTTASAGDSFVLPVAAGTQYTLDWCQFAASPPAISFTWMSFGSPPTGQEAFELVSTSTGPHPGDLGIPGIERA